jgi:hypothetical protein
VYADWVTVEKPYPVRELQTVYFDPATIRREGNLVAIWQLTDYKWMRGGGERHSSLFINHTPQAIRVCGQTASAPGLQRVHTENGDR